MLAWYGPRNNQLAMGSWVSWPLLAVRTLSEEEGLVEPYLTALPEGT